MLADGCLRHNLSSKILIEDNGQIILYWLAVTTVPYQSFLARFMKILLFFFKVTDYLLLFTDKADKRAEISKISKMEQERLVSTRLQV